MLYFFSKKLKWTQTDSSCIQMASRSRIFFRTILYSYAVVGYGIPYYCVAYHDTIKQKYTETRKAFKHPSKCFVFPFYYSRTAVEDRIRKKLESETGQFIFIYGKSQVGKSTIVRKICSQLQDGILRINAHSLQPFHQTLADQIGFTFHDGYSWRNLWRNIHFPLALCIENKGDHRDQLRRTLEHLGSFCKSQRLSLDSADSEDSADSTDSTQQRPWTLIIDDAELVDHQQFTDLYSSVSDLVDQNLLAVVVVSSDPVFAAFISNKAKFDKISRVQIDEMDHLEARAFLESAPCKSFVDRMRKHHRKEPISMREHHQCTQIAGGIPLWLVQCAAQTPISWYMQRVRRLRAVLAEQEDSESAYRMQSYMVGKPSLDFKDFVRAAGGVEDAIKLLHGLPRGQRQHRMFFHDIDRDEVALQYEYLMRRPFPSPRPRTTL